MAYQTTEELYRKALQTFATANEAVLMQSPARSLLLQAYAEFNAVMNHQSWFPCLFYQAQIAALLGQLPQGNSLTQNQQQWQRVGLNLYQRLFTALETTALDAATRTSWQVKAYSERARLLQRTHADGAIADLSMCIQLSNQHQFFIRRGQLYLMQGRLWCAADDFLIALDRLGEEKQSQPLQAYAASLRFMLANPEAFSIVLAELQQFWQRHY